MRSNSERSYTRKCRCFGHGFFFETDGSEIRHDSSGEINGGVLGNFVARHLEHQCDREG
jgi:hypothetical protein